MDDPSLDILDRRGRFARLAGAAAIGGVLTAVILRLVRGVAAEPNADALSQISPVLLAIGMFVALSTIAHNVLVRLRG